MKKETWDKSDIGLIMVVVGLLLMMLVLAGCDKETEHRDEVVWSNGNYQCAGTGTADTPAGKRCKRGAPSNIQAGNRQWYYCPEHYYQSVWIEHGRKERE